MPKARMLVRTIAAMAVVSVLCSAAYDGALKEQVDAVISAPTYKHAHWGILVADLVTGETLYEVNPDKLFAPASTTKLYTVASALDTFGADHRFETPILQIGDLDAEGNLNGNIVLVASGDLSFGGRTTPDGHIAFKDSDHTYANGNETAEITEPDPLAGMNELARQVAQSGIRRIRGEVLVDDRLFERSEGTGSGPSRLTPIIVNDNLIDFVVIPGKAGELAKVQSRPETVAYRVDARVESVAAGQETHVSVSNAGPGRIVVRGQIAQGHKPLVRVYEVEDAASFARSLLIEALVRAGVAVDASPLLPNRSDMLPPQRTTSGRVVAKLTSPPFSESARLILKVSHNLHASTLPLLVAAQRGKRTLAEGLRLQHDFLERSQIDVDTISFGGGAGGSRADYTTPRATVQLLRYMSSRPDFASYGGALPVLGVDGTLATSVSADSPARGKVRAKTGTLFWENTMNGGHIVTSKALAGYMESSHGRRLAFAMFVNNTKIDKASETSREGRALGKLCEIIYSEM
jgi:D-alanyl-D-alanine carboxypeptidase/D-alanyl-D-alanine-endopeptidase (penicillin-binding protein 4)